MVREKNRKREREKDGIPCIPPENKQTAIFVYFETREWD